MKKTANAPMVMTKTIFTSMKFILGIITTLVLKAIAPKKVFITCIKVKNRKPRKFHAMPSTLMKYLLNV